MLAAKASRLACTSHSLTPSHARPVAYWTIWKKTSSDSDRRTTSLKRRYYCLVTDKMASNGSTSASSSSKVVTKDKIYDEHWQLPQGTAVPKLKVFNSLTRSKVCVHVQVQTYLLHDKSSIFFLAPFKVDFVPQKGKQVTWYVQYGVAALICVPMLKVSHLICGQVQLRSDSIRCFTYGTCKVDALVLNNLSLQGTS